jgi:hypothetical protein
MIKPKFYKEDNFAKWYKDSLLYEREDDMYYDAELDKVVLCINTLNKLDLFGLMHEIGHKKMHRNFECSFPLRRSDVIREIEAWHYAFSCLKNASMEYFEEALFCVLSHNSNCFKPFRIYEIEGFLFSKLSDKHKLQIKGGVV